MSEYKRLTKQDDFDDFCENVDCPHKYIEELGCSINDCDNCYYKQIYTHLVELEDKIESGEIGDISAARHRAEAADMVIKELRKKLSKAEHDRDRYQRRIEVMKSENAALRERLDRSVELPCKVGDKVWVIDYDEEVVSYVCIGGNSSFLFLSPTIYAWKEINIPEELCNYYFDSYMELNDTDIVIFPSTKCFKTKEAAEARLKELQEGRNERYFNEY